MADVNLYPETPKKVIGEYTEFFAGQLPTANDFNRWLAVLIAQGDYNTAWLDLVAQRAGISINELYTELALISEIVVPGSGTVFSQRLDTIEASISGGAMVKTVYDTDDDGIVDNSEKLGGQLPAYYAKQHDLDTTNQALDTAVEDILDITPTKKEITWASGNTPITSLCYKIGNMVHIDFKMPYATGITNGIEIVGTVPAECIPSIATNYRAGGHANRVSTATYADNFGILCQVAANGDIYIANDFGIEMFGACVSIEYFIS